MRTARSTFVLLLAGASWFCGPGDGERLEPPAPPPGAAAPLLAERIRAATEAVRSDPTSAAAWGRLGEVYDVNSFGVRALGCYARAEELDPGEWRWPYFAGLILRSGDPAAALDRLSRAAELEPDYPAIRFHLGFAQYLAERFDLSRTHFLRALELDSGLINARLGLARIDVARGDLQAALSRLEPLARDAAGEGSVHVHLAQVYRELGRHEDADREERLTASSRFPARPDGFSSLADPVREEVRERESANSATLLVEARGHALAGRDEEAEAAVERALQADPDSVAALLTSARLLSKRGELDEARARLEHAVALDSASASVRVELAAAYVMTGRVGPAIDMLQEALELDPEQPFIKVNLAGLLLRTGRADAAVELLKEAHTALPDDEDIRGKLVGVLRRLGRSEEAERYERQGTRR